MEGAIILWHKMDISNPIAKWLSNAYHLEHSPRACARRVSSKGVGLMRLSSAFPNPTLQIEQGKITLSTNSVMPAMFKSKHLSFLITITQGKEELPSF